MEVTMKYELKFDEKSHTYTVGKTKLTPVTQFIHQFFKPFDEKSISKFCAKARRNKGEKITATQVRKEWRLTREKGTKMHQQLEDFSNGISPRKPLLETLQGIDYLNNKVLEWKLAPQLQEFRLFSKTLKLAGTIDKLVMHEDDLVSLVDYKQSKTIKMTGTKTKIGNLEVQDCNYYHYALQLSLYAYIMETEYLANIKELIVLHLTEDNYTEYVVPYLRDVVIQMLKVSKRLKE
jgi:hypothetical protein